MIEDGESSGGPASVRWVRTLDGLDCDTDLDVWILRTPSRTCRFDLLDLPGAGPVMRRHVREMMRVRLADTAPERLLRDLSRVRSLLACAVAEEGAPVIESFHDGHFLAYESGLATKSRYLAAQMRDFLLGWDDTGVGGLQQCLPDLLNGIDCPGHVVGAAVRTMCVRRGALSPGEQERLFQALHEAGSNESLAVEDYAICLLGFSHNLRPLQIALLKAGDLALNDTVPTMNVARLKQGKRIRPRTLLKRRELDAELVGVLRKVVPVSEAWADRNSIRRADAPLFPTHDRAGKDGVSLAQLPGLEGHRTSGAVSKRVICAVGSLGLLADDGSPMRLFPQRVRRTGGTNAAADGQPAAVIADVLDHCSLTTCRAYIQATTEMIERIDAALGGALDDWAAAFLADQSESRRTLRPGARA